MAPAIKAKILHFNFIHVTKYEYYPNNRRYLYFPLFIAFNELESVKSLSFKIFKELKDFLLDVYGPQPNLSQEDIKKAYEDCFLNNEGEQPYELFLLMRDGLRVKVDQKLNKRLHKAYDLPNLFKFDIEFTNSADFTRIRSEFFKSLRSQIP